MLGKNLVETIMGAFVLLVAAIFLAFAYLSSNLTPSGGYSVSAAFNSVGGLVPGDDVEIGGVKVGVVTRQVIDPKDYRAIIDMSIDPDVKLPIDTKAVIASASLLGGKYVKLEPGHDQLLIGSGGQIRNTEGAVNLEELLGKIIFLATDQGGAPSQPQGQGQTAAPAHGAAAPAAPAKPAAPDHLSPGK